MTREESTEMRELLTVAIQAGKKETSGLVEQLREEFKSLIETSSHEQIRAATLEAKKILEQTRSDAAKLLADSTIVAPRFVDVSRVPLICQSIVGIHDSLKEIREGMVTQVEFKPIKSIVFGLVGLILIAVVVALLGLVVLK